MERTVYFLGTIRQPSCKSIHLLSTGATTLCFVGYPKRGPKNRQLLSAICHGTPQETRLSQPCTAFIQTKGQAITLLGFTEIGWLYGDTLSPRVQTMQMHLPNLPTMTGLFTTDDETKKCEYLRLLYHEEEAQCVQVRRFVQRLFFFL